MVRTRNQTRREAQVTLPPPLPDHPALPSLPPPPPPPPSSPATRQNRKRSKGKSLGTPLDDATSSSSTLALSLAAIPPPSAPPRASIEALKQLFTPPPFKALRAAASVRQTQVNRDVAAAMGPPRATVCNSWQHKRWYKIFQAALQQNAESYATLIQSANPFADMALRNLVQGIIAEHPHLPPPAPADGFISWLLSAIVNIKSLPTCLRDSMRERNQRKATFRKQKQKTAKNYRVFKTCHAYAQFHFTILHLWLSALPVGQEYPPRAHWLVETQELYDMCVPFFENQRLADERRGRFPVHRVIQGKMQMVIPEGVNCLIYDRETNQLVCSVVRNFSRSKALLDWVSAVVGEGVDTRKSVRVCGCLTPSFCCFADWGSQLEDSGSIVLIGFSAGARSRPLFGLARNLLRKSTDTSAADVNNAAASAYFWMHVKMLHPREVSESIEGFHQEFSFPWLDPKWPYSQEISGDINLPSFQGHLLTFQDIEHGPGCMVYVQRYSR
jgi:hypothetical protein